MGSAAEASDPSRNLLDRIWDAHSVRELPNGQTRKLRFARGQYVAEYTIRRQENLTLMIVDYSTESPGRT